MSGSGVNAGPGQTPAGWFADPSGARVLRYWDGTAWTEHRWPMPGATPPWDALAAERRISRWAGWAFPMYAVLTIAVGAASLFLIHDMVQNIRHAIESSSRSTRPFMPAWTFGLQPVTLLVFAVQVVVISWTYRVAITGWALGIPARRSPPFAIAAWLIPIVNYWWPYQAVSDTVPDPAVLQPLLRWWWASYLAHAAVTVVAMVLATAFSPGVAAPLLVLTAGLAVTYALTGRRLVQEILSVHAAELEHRGLAAPMGT